MGKVALVTVVLFVTATFQLYWSGSALVVDNQYSLEVLQFDQPVGAVDGLCWKDGWLYMASEGSSAIYRANSSGHVETLATADDGLMSPEDLVVTNDGTVWWTDDDAGGIWSLNVGQPEAHQNDFNGPDDEDLQAWNRCLHPLAPSRCRVEWLTKVTDEDERMASTEGLGLRQSGELMIGDGGTGRVLELSAEGFVLSATKLTRIVKPESIVLTENDRMYVADDSGGVVVRVELDGTTTRVLDRKDGIVEPETLFYANKTLYIVDNGSSRLLRYDETNGLTAIAQFSGRLKGIQGITGDDDGNLYLSVQSNLARNEGYVLRLNRSGRIDTATGDSQPGTLRQISSTGSP